MHIIINPFWIIIILCLVNIFGICNWIVAVAADQMILCIIKIHGKKLILLCKTFPCKIPASPVIILHVCIFFRSFTHSCDKILLTVDCKHFPSYCVDKIRQICLHFIQRNLMIWNALCPNLSAQRLMKQKCLQKKCEHYTCNAQNKQCPPHCPPFFHYSFPLMSSG